jgi:hypothetical protein
VTRVDLGHLAVDALFVATVLAMLALVLPRLPGRARRALLAWLVLLGVLAGAGVFVRGDRIAPYFAGVVTLSTLGGVAFVCSRAGGALLAATSAAALVAAQSFRIVVELILWALALQHRVPLLITFEGRNVDILVGVTALPIAWLCVVRRRWPPAVAALWNVAGIAILANVVVHALLSAPTPFQAIWTDPPTTIIATLPYIWLPGFLVPLAFSLHVASLRALAGAAGRAREAS